jgi:hypothetical protein
MREPVRASSWLKLMLLRLTALVSFTGMETNPKLTVPLQIGLGMAGSCPIGTDREQAAPPGGRR